MLEKTGRAEKTEDHDFDVAVEAWKGSNTNAKELLDAVAAYRGALKGLALATTSFSANVKEYYSNSTTDMAGTVNRLNNCNQLIEENTTPLLGATDDVLGVLTAYHNRMKAFKKAIDQRNTARTAYDAQKREVTKLNEKFQQDPEKLPKAEAELESRTKAYETMNEKLKKEIPSTLAERHDLMTEPLSKWVVAERTFYANSALTASENSIQAMDKPTAAFAAKSSAPTPVADPEPDPPSSTGGGREPAASISSVWSDDEESTPSGGGAGKTAAAAAAAAAAGPKKTPGKAVSKRAPPGAGRRTGSQASKGSRGPSGSGGGNVARHGRKPSNSGRKASASGRKASTGSSGGRRRQGSGRASAGAKGRSGSAASGNSGRRQAKRDKKVAAADGGPPPRPSRPDEGPADKAKAKAGALFNAAKGAVGGAKAKAGAAGSGKGKGKGPMGGAMRDMRTNAIKGAAQNKGMQEKAGAAVAAKANDPAAQAAAGDKIAKMAQNEKGAKVIGNMVGVKDPKLAGKVGSGIGKLATNKTAQSLAGKAAGKAATDPKMRAKAAGAIARNAHNL